ncbi:uncharacterized protein LOC128555227 isoform X2 [Mercenaria mercenaria]|uniref:uncharacterized protein LOC128555227 isoform X2 n=1 Tax=Mercenaria mercenaria TaxID=6596 RepID=UPI00234F37A5|nr:uncharacterized protein LOC128555227 isoform X2 [Mercenaria mercenaria]
MSKADVEDNVSSPQRHQSKAIDEDENSGEVSQAAVEDNASSQRHQSKSVDEEPITSRFRILFERLRHLLSGVLISRRRKITDVSKMPENATIVQAERGIYIRNRKRNSKD